MRLPLANSTPDATWFAGNRYWFGGAAGLVVLSLGCTLLWRQLGHDATESTQQRYLILVVLGHMLAGAIFWLMMHRNVCRSRSAQLLLIILITGAGMRLAAAPAAPGWEDDFHRYLFDGAAVAHGLNPYQHAPDELLAAAGGRAGLDEAWTELAIEGQATLERVNHPELRTIYPPIAQGSFAIAYFLHPWSLNAWRLVIAAHDLLTLLLLLGVLRALGWPLAMVAIYWINPLLVKELYQSAHMDVLLMPWLIGAIWAGLASRTMLSVCLLAIASAVKLWPLALFPLVLRRELASPRRLLPAGVIGLGLTALLIAPMLLLESQPASGVSRYAEAWQNNAGFFALHHQLWSWLLPQLGYEAWQAQSVTRLATVGLFAIWVLGWVWRPIVDTGDFTQRALWIVAGLFLISPTQFPWYFLWVIPLLVLHRQPVILLYVVVLPLYHLQEMAPWTIWVQHSLVWGLLIIQLSDTLLRFRRTVDSTPPSPPARPSASSELIP